MATLISNDLAAATVNARAQGSLVDQFRNSISCPSFSDAHEMAQFHKFTFPSPDTRLPSPPPSPHQHQQLQPSVSPRARAATATRRDTPFATFGKRVIPTDTTMSGTPVSVSVRPRAATATRRDTPFAAFAKRILPIGTSTKGPVATPIVVSATTQNPLLSPSVRKPLTKAVSDGELLLDAAAPHSTTLPDLSAIYKNQGLSFLINPRLPPDGSVSNTSSQRMPSSVSASALLNPIEECRLSVTSSRLTIPCITAAFSPKSNEERRSPVFIRMKSGKSFCLETDRRYASPMGVILFSKWTLAAGAEMAEKGSAPVHLSRSFDQRPDVDGWTVPGHVLVSGEPLEFELWMYKLGPKRDRLLARAAMDPNDLPRNQLTQHPIPLGSSGFLTITCRLWKEDPIPTLRSLDVLSSAVTCTDTTCESVITDHPRSSAASSSNDSSDRV